MDIPSEKLIFFHPFLDIPKKTNQAFLIYWNTAIYKYGKNERRCKNKAGLSAIPLIDGIDSSILYFYPN